MRSIDTHERKKLALRRTGFVVTLAVVLMALSALVGVNIVFAQTRLDIVGIKIGMPLPAAMEALKAHDPRILRYSLTALCQQM